MSALRRWNIVAAERGDYEECSECGHEHFHTLSRTYTDCPVDECDCRHEAGISVTLLTSLS